MNSEINAFTKLQMTDVILSFTHVVLYQGLYKVHEDINGYI